MISAPQSPQSLIVVAGLSGAGKSTALRALADLGYYVIDNLPVPLFSEFAHFTAAQPRKYQRTAVLPDIDSRQRLDELLAQLTELSRDPGSVWHLLFLDCSSPTIVRRYSETRRPHPGFSTERDKSLEDAISRERERFALFKDRARYRIDTTEMTVHDLRRTIRGYVEDMLEVPGRITAVNFLSFGFKYGLPNDCDLIMDVRFLPNPHFVSELRDQSGLDSAVSDYVLGNPVTQDFLKLYRQLLQFLLPQYLHEGKSYINIGIGCTGGRHRSVAIAENLRSSIKTDGCIFSVKHRDIDRGGIS